MGNRLSINTVEYRSLFLDRLPRATQKAFLEFIKTPVFSNSHWYLAGGTALALQAGHRQSVDLDFFTTQKRFQIAALEQALLSAGQWTTTLRRRGTLYGLFNKAKASFIAYPFFAPSKQQLRCGTVRLLISEDIAVMKIVALSQRGRKRDFIDLYWYAVNREPLDAVIRRVFKQYKNQAHSLPHFLKSLTYFADAESDPMPKLFFDTSWAQVKKYFLREVPKIARELLGLTKK